MAFKITLLCYHNWIKVSVDDMHSSTAVGEIFYSVYNEPLDDGDSLFTSKKRVGKLIRSQKAHL